MKQNAEEIIVNDYQVTLTEDEVSNAKPLEAEYERLQRSYHSFKTRVLKATEREAINTYLVNPTSENFVALQNAILELKIFGDSRAREVAREVVWRFYEQAILPWFRAIVMRNLDAAKTHLVKITVQEETRHLKLVGRPLRQSEIIDAARRPVAALENIVSLLKKSSGTRSPGELLTSLRTLQPWEPSQAEPDEEEGVFTSGSLGSPADSASA